MLRTLPNWYGKIKGEIGRKIYLEANQLNIPLAFVSDSKIINDSIYNIMRVLVRLKENVRGEFNEEELKTFKKIGEGIKKEKAKKRSEKIKAKRLKSRKQSKK